MKKNDILKLFMFSIASCFVAISSVNAQSNDDFDLMLFNNDKLMQEKDVDTSKSFTDNLKKSSKDENKDENKQENWLTSFISGKKNSIIQSKENIVDEEGNIIPSDAAKQLINKRNNAAKLDIANIKLRMNPQTVYENLTSQGYTLISQKKEIPNFIKWRSEELCRQNGVIGFERLNVCATQIAKDNNHQFIIQEDYSRFSTKETIEVQYTSKFTDNSAYRIFYKSGINLSDSKASKNVYLNNIKVYDFWRRIDTKYGPPDNKTQVLWGLGGKKPYLKAATGTLELFDVLIKNLDVSRMLNEDTRYSNSQYYTF